MPRKSNKYEFDQIWIDKSALQYPSTHIIRDRLSKIPADIVDDVQGLKHSSDLNLAKRQLILTINRGVAFKACQGATQDVVCCGYHTIDLMSGCPCECTYCVLQHYLANNPMTTIYMNIEEVLNSVKNFLTVNSEKNYRIGTGELSDSLAYDHITGYSKIIVSFFSAQPNAVFEFKTKTANIDNLIGLKHNGRTVVAWSMNPQRIIESEEFNTASLDERLAAAKRCVDAGYRVGFHFDPIIHYKGWEKEYKEVVDVIYEVVPQESIAWISLGTFRFPPNLKTIATKRFPKSKIFYGEFIPANGKMRYFRPLREEIYGKMREWIGNRSKYITPYLCMETPQVCKHYNSISE